MKSIGNIVVIICGAFFVVALLGLIIIIRADSSGLLEVVGTRLFQGGLVVFFFTLPMSIVILDEKA